MLTQIDWLATELDESTSSLEDSRARTSALQEPESACPVSAAASGPSFTEYCLNSDPVGLSLRTSLGLELSALIGSSLTWQEQVTPLGRWWWVLSMPAPCTDGSGFGLLPTPSATTYGRNKGGQNPNGPERPSLETMAKAGMLPTPNSRDYKGAPGQGCQERGGHQSSLPAAVSNGPGTGRLSPCFVEWMQGYPAGWTDVSD